LSLTLDDEYARKKPHRQWTLCMPGCSPMSLIQSARLNGHDPYAYLKDVLTRLPTQRAIEIEQLLPHKWQPV